MNAADIADMLPELLPRLWAFALRISLDPQHAEKLVEHAYVLALERAHQLMPDTSPLIWMFSLLYASWINEPRVRHAHNQGNKTGDNGLSESETGTGAGHCATRLMHRRVVTAVEQLPAELRAVVLLVAVEGFTYDEAARILGIPVAWVVHHLRRARRAVESRPIPEVPAFPQPVQPPALTPQDPA